MNRRIRNAALVLATFALFAAGRAAGDRLPSRTDGSPESIVRAYLEAFKALDAATMVSYWADDARTIRDGQSVPVNRNQGDMRAFERATHTIWTYRIDRVAGESVTVTLIEDNDFYRALGVGRRTQRIDYVVRSGKIAEIHPISMHDEHGIYRDEYQRFLTWLVQQPSGNDTDIVRDGDFVFNENSGSKLQPWFDRYRSVHAAAVAQGQSFTVTLIPPVHGSVQLTPPLPEDGRYPAGTAVTISTAPDAGYVLDSAWYSVPGRFGQMYHEGMARDFTITIDQDKRVGASFIEASAVKDLVVIDDIVYAKPGVKSLKYDVFAPRGARNLPVIVIVHGGGWNTNDEDIMRGLARELVKGGAFVAASIDYRWLGRADGDATANTMADLVDDVFGAIAHVMEHAAQYGGDPTRIGLTGDSAGGHLVAVASLMTGMVGTRGFGKTPGVYEFMPSYLPKGKTVDQVREAMTKAIRAAAPSYGVFSPATLKPYAVDPAGDDSWVDAVAPLNHIPPAAERAVPQFLTRGTRDPLITDAAVKEYTDALVKAGQRVEYIQIGGASHAFFDWKPDDRTKATFAQYGVYYAQAMKAFFESVFR